MRRDQCSECGVVSRSFPARKHPLAVSLHEKGVPLVEIARRLGCKTVTPLVYVLKKHGRFKSTRPRVSQERLLEMKKLRKSGMSLRQIGDRLHVSKQAVYELLEGG